MGIGNESDSEKELQGAAYSERNIAFGANGTSADFMNTRHACPTQINQRDVRNVTHIEALNAIGDAEGLVTFLVEKEAISVSITDHVLLTC